MAIYLKTDNPSKLLKEFKNAIKDGSISKWTYDKEGDFTLTSDLWRNHAWLRPKIEAGRLALYILNPEAENISLKTYAIFHADFIESMLVQYDSLFTESVVTAHPSGFDKVAND